MRLAGWAVSVQTQCWCAEADVSLASSRSYQESINTPSLALVALSPRKLHLARPLLPSIILLSWTNQPHDVALVSSDQIILVLRDSSILKASSAVEPHSSLPFVFHLTLTCVRVSDRAEADQKGKAVISSLDFPASEVSLHFVPMRSLTSH